MARGQDGILSRGQLTRLGWNHDCVRHAIEAGRWSAHGKQAIALHTGPLGLDQRCWVALLNNGPTATLAGVSAASRFGLTGITSSVIHVVVAKGSWVPCSQGGLKVHISRRFSLADRHPGHRMPTVRVERGLIDGASWSGNTRRSAAVILAGVQQRLTTPERLRETLQVAGPIRNHRLIRQVIDDAEGGVHALSELDFAKLCRSSGLPMPTRQERRKDADGRIRYLDVRFVREDGRVLNVEIDGAAHFEILNAWQDMDRDIALLMLGEPTVRIPSAIVRADPDGVADRIRALLTAPW